MNDAMHTKMSEVIEVSASDIIELAESFDRLDDLTNQVKDLINDDKKITEAKEKSNTKQEEIEVLEV